MFGGNGETCSASKDVGQTMSAKFGTSLFGGSGGIGYIYEKGIHAFMPSVALHGVSIANEAHAENGNGALLKASEVSASSLVLDMGVRYSCTMYQSGAQQGGMKIVPFLSVGLAKELMKKADLDNKYFYNSQALTGLKLSDSGFTGVFSLGADLKSSKFELGAHYTLGLGAGSISQVVSGKCDFKF